MASTRNILLTLMVLIGTIVFFHFSGLDIWIQNHFYDRATCTWLVDRDNKLLDLLFYSGLKKLLIVIYSILLLLLIFANRLSWIRKHRKGLWILVLSAMLVPGATIFLKNTTNTPCPKNLKFYGQNYPTVDVLDTYPKSFCQHGKIKCWPAGHASFGFSLMALVFLVRSRRKKMAVFAFAMVVAWSMGTYKMLIGDHFFSHTLISMILGWLVILLIVRSVDTVSSHPRFNS